MSKVLVVTGASRGIGAATAKLAADQGYDVCVNYTASQEKAEAVADHIRSKGKRAITVQADVGSEADIVRLFKTVDDELGPLTAFFNNAGVIDLAARVDEFTADALERMLRINITGSMLCAREAVRRMSTKHGGKGGAIVNMSSAAARLGGANGLVHYATSKGAIDTFTKGLAEEVAPEGIRVNAVRPGIIDTEIHDDTGVPGRVEALGADREEAPDVIAGLLEDVTLVTTRPMCQPR